MGNAVMISPSIDAMIRAGVQFGAGWLVSYGNLDVTQTATISGAVLALIGVVWSILHKRANPV